MDRQSSIYRGRRFPAEIISHAVWLYYRFSLSRRDVEDLLAKRGVIVSHETVLQWTRKSGAEYARALVRRRDDGRSSAARKRTKRAFWSAAMIR